MSCLPDDAHLVGPLEAVLGHALDLLQGGVGAGITQVQVSLQHQRLQHLHDLHRGQLRLQTSVSDPHKFSCGSRSRIPKMSIWIRNPNFLFRSGSGSKGGKNQEDNLYQQIFN